MSESNVQQVRQALARYMAETGKKNTRQRDLIVDVFLEMGGHITLQELLLEVQKHHSSIGFATVYRTMKLLLEAGVVHERRFGGAQARYELVEFGEHHDHLICVNCEHIFEFEDLIIEQRQQIVAQEHGIRIKSHRHEIYGECLDLEACEARKSAHAER